MSALVRNVVGSKSYDNVVELLHPLVGRVGIEGLWDFVVRDRLIFFV